MVEKRTLVIESPACDETVTLEWIEDDEFYLEEPGEIVKWITNDIPELKSDKELVNAHFDGFDRRNFDCVHRLVKIFNEKVCALKEKWFQPGQSLPEFMRRRGIYDHIKFIMRQCYHRAVADATQLNKYQPGTPAVYGETSFDFVQQLMQKVNLSTEDNFIDLGSGVGNVVLQVSATSQVRKCFGVEKADIPSKYAADMLKQFRFWMRFYGKPYSPVNIVQGDFTAEEYRDTVHQSTVVFVNNYAFGPSLDQVLKEIFQCLPEGTRIIASGSFKPYNFRVNARNLNDVACILKIHECLKGKVSWTETPHPYFIYSIDRKQLEDYFDRTKNPKNRSEDEVRLTRKGDIAESLRDTTRIVQIEGVVNGDIDTRYFKNITRSSNGRRTRSAPGSKDVSGNSTANATPTEGATPNPLCT